MSSDSDKPLPTLLLDLFQQQAALSTNVGTILEEQNEAKVSRRGIHEKLDAVRQEQIRLVAQSRHTEERLIEVEKEVVDLKKRMTAYDRIRENINGGLVVLGAIGSVILIAIGFVLKQGWDWAAHHIRFS